MGKLNVMNEVERITNRIKRFRDERDWLQFHNHKDMALSLVLEAAELLEHFQWKSGEEVAQYAKTHKDQISDELADNLGINLIKAMDKKLVKNARKYPVAKARGKHTKYNKLT